MNTAPSTEVPAGDQWSALAAGYLGWTLDAFDFFLVTLCLTAIGREFHQPDANVALSLLLTLAFRPVGAFFFGMLADRYGRRRPLIAVLVFYSVVEVLSGLAPDYTTFLVLRALFGIGMGGEWGVGASLAMEKVPPRLRGLLSGFLQQGYATGNLLATICYFAVYPHFGWRPLFFLGGLPALLAIFVQVRVKESDVWKKTKHEDWGQLVRSLLSHWKLFLYLSILMMAMNLTSHGTQDLYPTLLVRRGFDVTRTAVLNGVSTIGAIIGGTLTGWLSDRWGRRRAMVAAQICAVLVVPLWAYAPNLALLFVGAFLIQFLVQGAWGVIPAHLTELSPDSVRGVLPGFGYQVGVLFASPVVYVEAAIARVTGYATAMASTAAAVLLFAAIVTWLGRERKAVKFGE